MSKTVSNIITASKTVAVVSSALLTQEVVGLNDDHQPHHRLRAMQEDDVASSSLSMRTTVISDDAENNKNNAAESKVAAEIMDEEEEKFQEKKQPSEILYDIGILVATIMKNGVAGEDLVDSLSQIDTDELRDDLTDIMKHLIGGPDAISASSPSYMSDELVGQNFGKSGKMGKSEGGKTGKSEASYTCTPGVDQCCPDDSEPPIGPFELKDVARGDECCEDADCFKYNLGVGCGDNTCGCEFAGSNGGAGSFECCETDSDCSSSITCGGTDVVVCKQCFVSGSTSTDKCCECGDTP